MAVTYSVNGGSEIAGVTSSWRRLRRRVDVDNRATFTNILVNRWRIPLMSMANLEVLLPLQGNDITSLETNNPEARASAVQYTTVQMGLVQGRQDGINMRDITLEFFVDSNSEV